MRDLGLFLIGCGVGALVMWFIMVISFTRMHMLSDENAKIIRKYWKTDHKGRLTNANPLCDKTKVLEINVGDDISIATPHSSRPG